MQKELLNKSQIIDIFRKNNLGNVSNINKLDIGFTNDIYMADNRYVLKVCIDEKNEASFLKESFCYNLFRGEIPVPNLMISDTSKKIINKYYMIYEKINGDNLYSKWHLMHTSERKHIISQLANILNRINATEYHSFTGAFNINTPLDWHAVRYYSLKAKLKEIEEKKILDMQFIAKIENYIEHNHATLFEQKVGLTYTDLHFDNVLVSGVTVTGILDFERTDLLSIDYALDTITRLAQSPHLYASQKYEKVVKKEDYTLLIDWFKEYSPDLFRFSNLNIRLALYALEYDMRLLLKIPEATGLKKRLAKTIGYVI